MIDQGVSPSGPGSQASPEAAKASSPSVSIPDAFQVRLAQGVVDLIREVGIYRLGLPDGCPCTDFEVQNVGVSVSCHKSGNHGVRIWTKHMDYCRSDYSICTEALRPIADEVLRQVDAWYDADGDYAATFAVSFEDPNAQAIEARRAETRSGSVADESAVGTADAPNPQGENQRG